jgi:hypothetical protein
MSAEESVSENATKGQRVKLPCGRCAANTFHIVQVSIDVEGDAYQLEYWEHYQIVQCQGCDRYSFRLLERNSEDTEVDPETGAIELVDNVTLFPPRIAGRPPLRNLSGVPLKVRVIYRETHKALLGKQPILAGVGIRALIEAVCREKNAKGGNLQKRIASLVDLGVLTRDGADILHALRDLGNSAAHEVEAQPEANLLVAFDVVEYLLNAVYIIPKKAAKLLNSRA